MKLTGKKARKLSKKKANIKKLQKVPGGASQKETFAEFELRRDIRTTTQVTLSW